MLRVWGAYIWRGLYMEGLVFGILRYTAMGMYRSLLAPPARTCLVIAYIKIGNKLLRHFH